MSFVIADFEETAVAAFSTITSETVIFAHQNAPRPKGKYFTLQVLSFNQRGEPQELQGNGDAQAVLQWSEMLLQVKAVGADSMSRAFAARNAMGLRWVVDAFGKVFAGMGEITTVQNVPVVRTNGWEDQSVFDVRFNVVTETAETLRYIASVEAQGTIGSQTLTIE
jgi:hypothetical protein